MGIDEPILDFVSEHRFGALDSVARGVMDVGTSFVALAIVGVVALLWVWRAAAWRAAVAAGLAFVSSTVLCEGLKRVVDRHRPPAHLALVHVAGSSMPSTHAARTAAVAIAFVAVFDWPSPRLRNAVAGAASVVVFGIGACLVYLGVHWTTDVLAGWLVGVLCGTASARVARRGHTRPAPAR